MTDRIKGERELIANTDRPITHSRLVDDLRTLGVRSGACVLTHVSLSRIGWIPGDVQTLIEALLETLSPDGTLVAPAHSTHLTDPVHWENPPVPTEWQDKIRASLPVFDVARTPTRGLGRLPEALRHWPGTIRSSHPHNSFTAIGKKAKVVTSDHALDSPMGTASPLQKLYDLDADILFLGTGWETCTAFHLAEARIPEIPTATNGTPALISGRREWVTYESTDYDSSDFAKCGDAFEMQETVRKGLVGQAECRLFSLRSAVDFAEEWIRETRLT